jgi:uncharacterized protein
MKKIVNEIRDPIHIFARIKSDERRVLDSPPFQRLRNIHQLATTYLVYPGATHRRFEHSLGVMELADRVFDMVTRPEKQTDEIRNQFEELGDERRLNYWRCVLRMAALCHDTGHLPFSHAAEKELLPETWSHERMTAEIIRSESMRPEWKAMKIEPEDVIKIALGPEELKKFEPEAEFSPWETILAEIIVGDAFGVDRMDYLLRDSHHAGVAYGKFDHYRLVDTLRILPTPAPETETDGSTEPPKKYTLGVEQGGLQSAESMMLARYFMFSQVYLHRVRRIYDIHLKDFLAEWLKDGKFSTAPEDHMEITDMEVTAAILHAARDRNRKGSLHAQRIVGRKHFKVLYERNPKDVLINPEAGEAVYRELCSRFGKERFRHDRYMQKGASLDFPVQLRDGSVISSLSISKVLKDLPVESLDYVFGDRNILVDAERWLKENREDIIKPRSMENDDEQA